MKYKKSKNDMVNEYVESLDKDIAPLVLEIRGCVLAAGPSLNESIKVEELPRIRIRYDEKSHPDCGRQGQGLTDLLRGSFAQG